MLILILKLIAWKEAVFGILYINAPATEGPVRKMINR